jgi:hypothetical protein
MFGRRRPGSAATSAGQAAERADAEAVRMPASPDRTVIVLVPRACGRAWVRALTARLLDLPGVECVRVEEGRVVVTGTVDPERVRAMVVPDEPSRSEHD